MPKLFIAYWISIFRYLVTLHRIWFTYHGYVRKIIGCRIFRHYNSLSFYLFLLRGLGLPSMVLICYPHLFRMLGSHRSCICDLFPTRWSPCSFWCDNTCWNWHFPLPIGFMKYLCFITLGCPLSRHPLLKVCIFIYGLL